MSDRERLAALLRLVGCHVAPLIAEVRADERAYLAAVMRDVERTQAAERPRDGDRWAAVVEMLDGAR